MSDEKKEPDEQAAQINEVDDNDLAAVSGGFDPQPEPPGIAARTTPKATPLRPTRPGGSITPEIETR